MNLVKIYFLCLVTGLFIFQSCNKDQQEVNKDSIYEIKSNSKVKHQLSKESYMELSFGQQNQIWTDRLNGFLNENIPNKEKELIESVINQLETYKNREDVFTDETMKKDVLELANIIPTKRFKIMFSTLDAFNIKTKYENNIDKEFIQQLKTDFEKLASVQNSDDISEQSLVPKPWCNCKWTCGGHGSYCSHTYCKPTSSGCGFLWLHPCIGKDELFPSPHCSYAEQAG